MATDSAARSVTNTLTTTVADTVTLVQGWPAVAITNHHATEILSARVDGLTAVGEANDNYVILGTKTLVVGVSPNAAGQVVVSVVGSANKYTIAGVSSPTGVVN